MIGIMFYTGHVESKPQLTGQLQSIQRCRHAAPFDSNEGDPYMAFGGSTIVWERVEHGPLLRRLRQIRYLQLASATSQCFEAIGGYPAKCTVLLHHIRRVLEL